MTPEFWSSAVAAAAGTVAAMGVIGSGGLLLWKFGRGSIANDLAPNLGLHFRSQKECNLTHQADLASHESARIQLERDMHSQVEQQVRTATAQLEARVLFLEGRQQEQGNMAERIRKENREDFRKVFDRLDLLADRISQLPRTGRPEI